MTFKNELLKSIEREFSIIKHLYAKVPEGGFDFRFSHKQRSTLQLLQYLSWCALVPIRANIIGNWDEVGEYVSRTSKLTAADIPAALDRELADIRELFATITEEDLLTREGMLPWGEKLTLGGAIMEMSVKWLTGYRMQLFLHVKAAGVHHITTPNNWMGVDWNSEPEPDEAMSEATATEPESI